MARTDDGQRRVPVGPLALLGAVLLVVVGVTVGGGPDPTVEVTVAGGPRQVPIGTTLGAASAVFHLEPRAGALLDVEDEVLEEDAFPGRILLNGHEAKPSTVLAPGDRIRVVDGQDRHEGVAREVIEVREGNPGNPQFFLATTPGRTIVIRGEVSGKVVSTEFKPSTDEEIVPAVALTFDDGPSRVWTGPILEVLRRHGVPATFFVVGYLAQRYPDLVEREVREGHQVASHSYGHPLSPQFELLSKQRIVTEIRHARNVLRDLGVPAGLFRPPFGSYDAQVLRIAKEHGQRLVLWNVDPGDWKDGATVQSIMRNVREHVRAGSIILLHDGGGDRSATLAALPKIITYVRSLGLDLVAIGASKP
jgi:peptidoglycan/xylan/chitin deacetylase (PgdA/CDA1 family)